MRRKFAILLFAASVSCAFANVHPRPSAPTIPEPVPIRLRAMAIFLCAFTFTPFFP